MLSVRMEFVETIKNGVAHYNVFCVFNFSVPIFALAIENFVNQFAQHLKLSAVTKFEEKTINLFILRVAKF